MAAMARLLNTGYLAARQLRARWQTTLLVPFWSDFGVCSLIVMLTTGH